MNLSLRLAAFQLAAVIRPELRSRIYGAARPQVAPRQGLSHCLEAATNAACGTLARILKQFQWLDDLLRALRSNSNELLVVN